MYDANECMWCICMWLRTAWNTIVNLRKIKLKKLFVSTRWKRLLYWGVQQHRSREWHFFVFFSFVLLFSVCWMMITSFHLSHYVLSFMFRVFLRRFIFRMGSMALDTGFRPFNHNNLLFKLTYNSNWCVFVVVFQSIYLYMAIGWKKTIFLSLSITRYLSIFLSFSQHSLFAWFHIRTVNLPARDTAPNTHKIKLIC